MLHNERPYNLYFSTNMLRRRTANLIIYMYIYLFIYIQYVHTHTHTNNEKVFFFQLFVECSVLRPRHRQENVHVCISLRRGKRRELFEHSNHFKTPVPVAARSKAQVYGRSPAEIVGSNPTGGMDVCRECRMLSGRGRYDQLIIRPEES